jgi:hypothetical protein
MKPIYCRWDGTSLRPIGKHSRTIAETNLALEQTYLVSLATPRSKKDHAHFMALVTTAWENLPESEYDRFPDPDTLRYDAAIHTNHYDVQTYPCRDMVEVKWCLGWTHRLWPNSHTAVLEDPHGKPMVVVKTAKSMSFDNMDQKYFHQMKQDIIDYLGAKLGVDLNTLSHEDIYTP